MSPVNKFTAYGSYSTLRASALTFIEPKRFKRDDFPVYNSQLRLRMLADHIDGLADMINEWTEYHYAPNSTTPLNKQRLCDVLLARGEILRQYADDTSITNLRREEIFTNTLELMVNFIRELKTCYVKR